jgi:hypothetical protein
METPPPHTLSHRLFKDGLWRTVVRGALALGGLVRTIVQYGLVCLHIVVLLVILMIILYVHRFLIELAPSKRKMT